MADYYSRETCHDLEELAWLLAAALALALAHPASARVLKINESLGLGSVDEAALQHFK